MLTVDEGMRPIAYKDTVGKTTVGIGFNMDEISARDVWKEAGIKENFDLVYNKTIPLTVQSAWALVTICVNRAVEDLKTIFHDYDTYPENIKLALINLMYNMGLHTFREFNTFIGRVRVGNYTGAATDLAGTKWATQVPNRAIRVCDLLKDKDYLYAV